MDMWGFVILGVFALGVLISIGNDVRSISSRLESIDAKLDKSCCNREDCE